MKKVNSILVLLALSAVLAAQRTDSIHQIIGYVSYNIKYKQINSYCDLPDRIKNVASNFIENSFSKYNRNIKFVSAQVFPLDSVFNSDLEKLYEQNRWIDPVPNYILNYSFRARSIGISQYWIRISFDTYGQVISCNFPKFTDNLLEINSLEESKEFSDSIVASKYPTINKINYLIELSYNEKLRILSYQICYLKNEAYNKEEYTCLLINAHKKELIEERSMCRLYDDPIDCCIEDVKLEFIKEDK